MFTQFGATADSLSKASTLVFRIGTDAHLYDDPEDVNIAPLLDSKFDSEKCEALKRLLALIAQGFDVSNFFPQVVKNVAIQSLEVKKLVYLYLLHYAEKRPNEALLSINYFQKDLGDTNPLVRAWALRTMAGIRLHMIAPLVLVAVNKCARDPSVYVRKCAANALPKLQDLRLEENTEAIEQLVGILLNDNSPAVIGSAAAAFASICPNNLTLIARNYRRLCETLPDVEEWGQIVLIGILLRYVIARHGLVRESIMAPYHISKNNAFEKEGSDSYFGLKVSRGEIDSELCRPEITYRISRSYLEGPDKYLSSSTLADVDSSISDPLSFSSAKDNEDIKVLLQCTSPLMWSHNSAVVLAAAGLHWVMAPLDDLGRIVKPLLFILRSSSASKHVVLCNIQVFCKATPSIFAPHFEDFFVTSLDSYEIKALKLEILSSIATESSISDIFLEFQDYVWDPDRRFAADTVAAIGLCAQHFEKVVDTCLEGLLVLISSELLKSDTAFMDGETVVLIQAIYSVKEIVKNDPCKHEKVIVHLVRNLDSILVSSARAMVIWMLGEFNNAGCIIPKILPTVLKYLAFCFTKEEAETKLQIINACTKVALHAKEDNFWTFRKILSYVLDLGRWDLNYDVRDRARLAHKLLSVYIGSCDTEDEKSLPDIKSCSHTLAECIFGGHVRLNSSEPGTDRFYLPGSLSHMVLHAAPGYEPLPNPSSLILDSGLGTNVLDGATPNGSSGSYGGDSASGSWNEERTSDYSSQDSDAASDGLSSSNASASASEVDVQNGRPLIQLSDFGDSERVLNTSPSNLGPGSEDFGELMSSKALESWLEQNPSSNNSASTLTSVNRSSARISIGDISSRVEPKSYSVLDPANGNGLKVSYVFSSKTSSVSSLHVCLEVCFENCSPEPMSNIQLVEEKLPGSVENTDQASSVEASSSSHGDVPTLLPMEEIRNLDSGEITTRVLNVHFHHHLLPLKLVLLCNGKTHLVKLRPDIGFFLKPLPMDMGVFSRKEAQLPGMFECTRRCIFTDHIGELKKVKVSETKDYYLIICEGFAVKMLTNVNLFLVSVDIPVSANLDDASGLSIRFSGELLSKPVPCLVTLTLDGNCFEPLNVSVKINCEDTVFSLNLLNRIVNFLAEAVLE